PKTRRRRFLLRFSFVVDAAASPAPPAASGPTAVEPAVPASPEEASWRLDRPLPPRRRLLLGCSAFACSASAWPSVATLAAPLLALSLLLAAPPLAAPAAALVAPPARAAAPLAERRPVTRSASMPPSIGVLSLRGGLV